MVAPGSADFDASIERRRLGRRGPLVTTLGLGGAPLGNLYSEISDDDADRTVAAAWDRGIRLFDTAPLYGSGLSEIRLGAALASRPRDQYVLATKVGRLLVPVTGRGADPIFARAPALAPVFDFGRDAILRSISDSLGRLGVDRLDIVHVHDPDDHEDEAMRSAFPALIQLRDEGVIGAVGCGMNQWAMLSRFVERVDLDAILLAGRYTLLDRSGADLLGRCAERSVGVIVGGVFNSGLLADPGANVTYDYRSAPKELLERARMMDAIVRRGGATLAGAAIQFALRHPAVSAVVIGARSPREIEEDTDAARRTISDDVWAQLDPIGTGTGG